MSMFRGSEIYVQAQTKRRLRWIAKAIGVDEKVNEHSLADQFLNEIIEARFPQIIEAEAEFSAAEQRFSQACRLTQCQP